MNASATTLGELAARLAGLVPGDADGLSRVHGALVELSCDLDVPPFVRYSIGEALRTLAPVPGGEAGAREAAVADAVRFLRSAHGGPPTPRPVVSGQPSGDCPPAITPPPGDNPPAIARAGLRLTVPAGWQEKAAATRDTFLANLAAVPGPVVLDLAGCAHLDAAGLRVLLGLFRTCDAGGRAFSVAGVGPALQPVFAQLHLVRLFPVTEAV